MEMQLKDLVVFWTILLLKPSLLRQIGNDLEEYPRALTSIANRSTTQPFFSMTFGTEKTTPRFLSLLCTVFTFILHRVEYPIF